MSVCIYEASTYRYTLIDKCQISLVSNVNYSSDWEIRMVSSNSF